MYARANMCLFVATTAVAALLVAQTCAADRIAYQGRLVMGSRGIVVMSGSGENPVELPHPGGSDRITPALSPDGTLLAYAAKAGDSYKLWVVRLADDNAPAEEPKQLTTGDSNDEQPAWSPDGQRIAYVSGAGDQYAIMAIPVSGGTPALVARLGSDFRSACPHWSPDGSRIVFSSAGKLFIAPAAGAEARQLTDDGMYPSWSPDGSQIAFFRLKPEPALGVISPDGGEPRVVLKGAEFFGETVWSPDGKYIAFKADKVGGNQGSIWIVPAAGGQAKSVRSYGVVHGYFDWSTSPGTVVASAPGAAKKPVVPVRMARVAAKPAKPVLAKQAVAKPAVGKIPVAPKAVAAKKPEPARPVVAKAPAAQKVAAEPTLPVLPPVTAPAPTATPAPEPAKAPEAPPQIAPVRIVSPADGAVVRGITKVTASKDKSGGYVSFFVDGSFAKATMAPFEIDWDTRPSGDGPHTVTVTGYGASGEVEGTAETRVDVRNAIGQEALPQEGIPLRYRYKEKEKWEYEVRVSAQAGAKGEVPLPAAALESGTLAALVTQRVENVKEVIPPAPPAAAGAPPVAGSGQSAAGQPRKPETVAMVVTQVRTGRLDSPGAGGRLPQVGQAARSSRTLDGRVMPVAAPGGQPIALGNLSIVFPPDPVKVGDKWNAPMTILPVLRSSAVAKVNAEHKVEGVQWEQGLETVRIVSTFKVGSLPVGVGGMALDNVSGTRTTWFAYKEHQVIRMEDTIQGTFNQKAALAAAQPGAGAYGYTPQAPRAGMAPAVGGVRGVPPRLRGGMSLGLGGRRSLRTAPQAQTSQPWSSGRVAPRAIQPGRLAGGGGLRLNMGGRTGMRGRPVAPYQPGMTPVTPQRQPAQVAAQQQAAQASPALHYTLRLVETLQK